MSNLAVETCPCFALPSSSGRGFLGPRGQGFQCCTRGGWQGPATQMTAPDRAARLWVAGAGATWWRRMRVGRALEVGPPPEGAEVPERRPVLGAMVAPPGRPRRLRWLRLGWWWCLVCQSTTGGLPLPQRFVPEPWPAIPMGVLVVTVHQKTL
jgi:hypothetical protein